jgi:hypothetical protein
VKWARSITVATILLLSIATFGVLSVRTDKTLNPIKFNDITSVRVQDAPVSTHIEDDGYRTTYTPEYTYSGEEEDLKGLQCPIPMACRVKNGTGIQCVWSSIEMLGRWAEEPKLMNPPLTSRSDCKSYSSPSLAATRMNQLNVKFEQSYKDRTAGVKLLKKAMSEGRGCLWGVPGHAMVIVHYSEEENKMCWVDNSDRSLSVQKTTIEGFNKRWDSWILVIYADNDIIPHKMGKILVPSLPRLIPIIDRNNPQGAYPKDYIPMPNR